MHVAAQPRIAPAACSLRAIHHGANCWEDRLARESYMGRREETLETDFKQ